MMLKFLTPIFILLVINIASAQDNTSPDTLKAWKTKGQFGLKLNQVSFTNWAAGGENSIATGSVFGISANYKKEKWLWDNKLHLGFGITKQGKGNVTKNDDQILFHSNAGHQINKSWYGAANLNFRTQFTKGKFNVSDSLKLSDFMSPGYIIAGIGFSFKPSDKFKASFDVLSNKTTIVLDEYLSSVGAFGVDSLSKYRAELGGHYQATFKDEIIKNITFFTSLALWSNYIKNPLSIDINWDVIIDFKVNDFISANITTQLIYDEDIPVPYDSTGDGNNDATGSRVQFRQAFGIGLTANF